MKSIVLIIPYFGKWPIWFEAHLVSISKNPTINWLFMTDCNVPREYPKNSKFIESSLESFNEKVNMALELEVPLNYRKICDIRPAFGTIFKEEIKEYDFWGFCDVDIIWGDIRKFMIPNILNSFDVISALDQMLCGHFTLIKNTPSNNKLYTYIDNYKELFKSSKHHRIDEGGFTNTIAKLKKDEKVTVFWDKKNIDKGIESMPHQEYKYDRWLYKEGKIHDLEDNRKEYMYLHFINWKKHMIGSEVIYLDNPSQFYISFNKIHFIPHSNFTKKIRSIINIFNGYWVNDRRRIRKHKCKSFFKRLKNRVG